MQTDLRLSLSSSPALLKFVNFTQKFAQKSTPKVICNLNSKKIHHFRWICFLFCRNNSKNFHVKEYKTITKNANQTSKSSLISSACKGQRSKYLSLLVDSTYLINCEFKLRKEKMYKKFHKKKKKKAKSRYSIWLSQIIWSWWQKKEEKVVTFNLKKEVQL